MSELKPCPFCGGTVEAWNERAEKRGMWLCGVNPNGCLECSECGYVVDCNENSNYCPMCGARME